MKFPAPAWVCALVTLAGCTTGPGPAGESGRDFIDGFDEAEEFHDRWIILDGDWTLVDRLDAPTQPHAVHGRTTAGDHARLVAAGAGDFRDGSITTTQKAGAGTTGGLILHAIDSTAYHAGLWVQVGSRTQFRIVEYFEGETTTLGETVFLEWTSTDWETIRFESQDGTLKLTWPDGSLEGKSMKLTIGKPGLIASSPSFLAFDDVVVDAA